jgi:hypothetical protein
VTTLALASRVLADDGNGATAGLGLIVFLVLLVGCVFLFRSMNARIKRLPASFDPPTSPDDDAPVSSPDAAGSP